MCLTFFSLPSTLTAHIAILLKVGSSTSSLNLIEWIFWSTNAENFLLTSLWLKVSWQYSKICYLRAQGKSRKSNLGILGTTLTFSIFFGLVIISLNYCLLIFYIFWTLLSGSIDFFTGPLIGWTWYFTGLYFALTSLLADFFLSSIILLIISSKFSLLALLIKIEVKMSRVLSSADMSVPLRVTLSVF